MFFIKLFAGLNILRPERQMMQPADQGQGSYGSSKTDITFAGKTI
jgi:hypothetical protein